MDIPSQIVLGVKTLKNTGEAMEDKDDPTVQL